jgi:hypothetical protein
MIAAAIIGGKTRAAQFERGDLGNRLERYYGHVYLKSQL